MQFFFGKGHFYEEFVIFYWNISMGTKAKTRGMEAIASVAFVASVKHQTWILNLNKTSVYAWWK